MDELANPAKAIDAVRDDLDEIQRSYLVDGEVVGWRKLIKMADAIDDNYARDCLKQSSVAATILREAGHTVIRNA